MIPSMIAKKVLPYLLEPLSRWIFKSFPGINKLSHLVKYMEEDNEADIACKQLADEIDTTNNKLDNLNDLVAGLKKQIKELKNGNK